MCGIDEGLTNSPSREKISCQLQVAKGERKRETCRQTDRERERERERDRETERERERERDTYTINCVDEKQ